MINVTEKLPGLGTTVLLIAAGAALLILAAGCGSGNETTVDPNQISCSIDEDCPLGKICYLDICSELDAPCGGCPDGRSCIDAKCITSGCSVDADCVQPGYCQTISGLCSGEPDSAETCQPPCTDGQICLGLVCQVPPCRFDDDCPASQRCRIDDGNRLGDCIDIECSTDANCRDTFVCNTATSRCMEPCTSDASCPAGYQCYNGHCDELPPECENDYDCNNQKICDPYKQCIRGEPCDPDNETADLECGQGRMCGDELRRCIPEGCVDDEDCEVGICEPENHTCVNKIPTGGGCAYDDQCLSTDVCYANQCTRLCQPLAEDPGCQGGYVCAIIIQGEHMGMGMGVCRPYLAKNPAGVVCSANTDCNVDLLCIDGFCAAPCDTEASDEDSTCKATQICEMDATYGLGVCRARPCDGETILCPEGKSCIDGLCVECVQNADCGLGFRCENNACAPDCTQTGCPEANTICDRTTGTCEYICTPGCNEYESCVDGTCVEARCEPACGEGYYCYHGNCKEIACVDHSQACGALASIPGAECCSGLICCELFSGSGGYCCNTCNVDGTCAN